MKLRRSGVALLAAAVSHVLVVDDDPHINLLVRTRLGSRGYKVEAAYDGLDALARLEMRPPDLIFLDIAMPEMDGLAVLDHIRARGLDTAVILMTAFGSEQVAIDALRRGADDYLRKPFDPSEFQAVLERTVSRLELTRQNVVLRRQLDEKRRQLEVELARAAKVQVELLPHSLPDLAGFDLAARCLPALEVGGDFYDWQQPSPDIINLILADVAGKGMAAALLMATVRATVRAAFRQHSPAMVVEDVALALADDLERSQRIVTLFLARLDLTERRLTYVDAGHGHVFMRRAGGELESLPVRGLPVGVLLAEPYHEGVMTFNLGDTLLLYSDGLIDAQPEMACDQSTLATLLHDNMSALDMVNHLIEWAGPATVLPDDLAIVVLRCIH